jgi:hypothetical protein
MDMQLRQIFGFLFVLISIGMIWFLYTSPKASDMDGFVDAGRCGVDLPSCSPRNDNPRVRCMNGYCKSDIPPQLPILSDLPVIPPRYPYLQ